MDILPVKGFSNPTPPTTTHLASKTPGVGVERYVRGGTLDQITPPPPFVGLMHAHVPLPWSQRVNCLSV